MNTCCFTGHRPDKLYGYDSYNIKYKELSKKLESIIVELITNHNVDTFISGGALGFDTVAFLTVNRVKKQYSNIKNVMAIPFKNQDIKWNNDIRILYTKMKNSADELVFVDEIDDYLGDTMRGSYSAAKMQIRNKYMVDKSNFIIACWNGDKKGGTYNCINYAEKTYNMENIIMLNPDTLIATM